MRILSVRRDVVPAASARTARWGRTLLAGLILLSAAIFAATGTAAEATAEKTDRDWIRVTRDEHGRPSALQTAVVRYVPADGKNEGPTVDLIAAVHVGDRAYYAQLNRDFKQYDALLYELVAPKGVKIKKGRKNSSRSFVGAMQNGMKQMLELEHQVERIDYTQKNFVHADMSPEQFAETMKERGESFFTMFLRIMGQSIAQQSQQQGDQASDLDILMALFDRNRAQKLKVIMAQQFEQMESLMVGFGGPAGSTIITERNKVALEVLADRLKAGDRRLGIFYGAGHMDDLDQRLQKDFDLKPAESRWVTAWKLKPASDAGE